MQFQRCSSVLHTSREGIACEIGGTARFVLECRSSGCQIAAWPASSRGVRAAGFALWPGHGRPPGTEAAPPGSAVPDAGAIWGFCTIRSLSSACRRRVAALMVQFPHPLLQQEDGVRRVAALLAQFPPFAGSEVAVRGGEVTVHGGDAPTSPATSPKNADNGGLWARCPASWWQRYLASCVARTRTAEYAR